MGSFNVVGSMSKCSIGRGDRVVFFPLVALHGTRKGRIKVKPRTSLHACEGPAMFYTPRFLPLVGRYDGEGGLEKIERDANVAYIEAYFGMTIDAVTEAIIWKGRGFTAQTPARTQELATLAGMFEHHDVYRDMVTYAHTALLNAYTRETLSSRMLTMLGFERCPALDHTEDRFTEAFVHPGWPEYVGHCDGTYTRFTHVNSGQALDAHVHTPADLVDVMTAHGRERVTATQIQQIRALSMSDVALQRALDQIETLKRHADVRRQRRASGNHELLKDPEIMRALEAFKAEMAQERAEHPPEPEIPIVEGLENYRLSEVCERLPLLKQQDGLRYVLGNEALHQGFVDLCDFHEAMWNTNTLYMPAMSGEQGGNHRASHRLLQSTERLLNTKLNQG